MGDRHKNNAAGQGQARKAAAANRRHLKKLFIAGIVLALLIGASVLVTQRQSPQSPRLANERSGIVQITKSGGSAVGENTPAFSLRTIDGDTFAAPSERPTVLFFMAGWCASCYPEARALSRINQDFEGRLSVLAVSADTGEGVPELKRFADQVGATYGFAQDKDGALTQALDVGSLDTTVVIDANGTIVYRDAVPTSEQVLRSAITKVGLA